MKKWLIALGALLILMGLMQGGRYITDYKILTQYGKGYVFGSVFLMLLGIILVLLGIKGKKNNH